MATLVLNRDSLSVKLESNHLVIHEHSDGSFLRMPLVDVERVIVVGQPAISFHVLAKLLDRKIPCSFMTHGGRWRGLMDGDSGFHAARRLRRVARICEDYGRRVEKSVFECDLEGEAFADMWHRLSGVICNDVDGIIDYPVGNIDRKRIRTLGVATHSDPQGIYVF